MRESTQARFDTAKNDGYVGIEFAQNLTIDDGGVFRSHIVTPVRRVCVLAPKSASRSVFVHHRVHATWSNAEPQTRSPQTTEVAQVTVPVGLRNDGHTQSFCLEQTPDDSHPERGMVDIGIGREQDDVGLFPASQFHLLAGGRKPAGDVVSLFQPLRTWRDRAG